MYVTAHIGQVHTRTLLYGVKTPYLPFALLVAFTLLKQILLFAIFQGLYFNMLYQDSNRMFSLHVLHIMAVCTRKITIWVWFHFL